MLTATETYHNWFNAGKSMIAITTDAASDHPVYVIQQQS